MSYLHAKSGEQIHVRTEGNGRSFVLFHPLGRSSRHFDSIARAIVSRGHQSIRFDLPGHGSSSLAVQPQTLTGCLEITSQVLNLNCSEAPVFVGVGFGAYLAIQTILSGSARPICLVMKNPTIGASSWLEQQQQSLHQVMADKLSARATSSLSPFPANDLFEQRQSMTRSVRAMSQYQQILTQITPVDLDSLPSDLQVETIFCPANQMSDQELLSALFDNNLI